MVRELSREPAMFQIGLQGEVLKNFRRAHFREREGASRRVPHAHGGLDEKATASASYRIEKPRNPEDWRNIGEK